MTRTFSLIARLVFVPLATIAGVATALNVAGGEHARFAALFAAFILVADLATFVRGRVQNTLVVCATLLFGLSVLEMAAHALIPQQRFTHGKGLFGDRPEIGWGPGAPGRYPVTRTQDGKLVYKATYTIDPDLLRHVNSDTKGPTIAIFGDSFTFGEGVDDDATMPQHFADLAHGTHVLNLGFSAYSPAQALREMQAGLFDAELKGARLFLLQTGPLHAERIACKAPFSLRGPRYVVTDGKPTYDGPCTSGLWRKVREFTSDTAIERLFVSPLARKTTRADVEAYLDVVSEVAALSQRKYGVPLVVVFLDSPKHMLDGTGFDDSSVIAALRSRGIEVIRPDMGHSDAVRIPLDGHFSDLGNKLIAQQVYTALQATQPQALKP